MFERTVLCNCEEISVMNSILPAGFVSRIGCVERCEARAAADWRVHRAQVTKSAHS